MYAALSKSGGVQLYAKSLFALLLLSDGSMLEIYFQTLTDSYMSCFAKRLTVTCHVLQKLTVTCHVLQKLTVTCHVLQNLTCRRSDGYMLDFSKQFS